MKTALLLALLAAGGARCSDPFVSYYSDAGCMTLSAEGYVPEGACVAGSDATSGARLDCSGASFNLTVWDSSVCGASGGGITSFASGDSSTVCAGPVEGRYVTVDCEAVNPSPPSFSAPGSAPLFWTDADQQCSSAPTQLVNPATLSNGAACYAIAGTSGSIEIGCAAVERVRTYADADDCTGDVLFETTDGGGTCLGIAFSNSSGDEAPAYTRTVCDRSACYSGSATAELEGGERVPVSALRVGDRVLTAAGGRLSYDRVFRVTHWDEEARDEVVRLETRSGHVLELTGSHYVHANTVDQGALTLARDVREGDTLFVAGEDGAAVSPSPVVRVGRARARGLYNVHTLGGGIVLNGVAATHYTAESSFGAANWLAPAWNALVDALSPLVGTTDVSPR